MQYHKIYTSLDFCCIVGKLNILAVQLCQNDTMDNHCLTLSCNIIKFHLYGFLYKLLISIFSSLEADKRKRVRLDTHLAEAAAIAQSEPDGSISKIPKIKIVFQHKGPGIPPPGPQEPFTKMQGPVLDINTEAKTAIKNKLKRNKLDPIVISLPSASMMNKDPLQQQSMKQQPPSQDQSKKTND